MFAVFPNHKGDSRIQLRAVLPFEAHCVYHYNISVEELPFGLPISSLVQGSHFPSLPHIPVALLMAALPFCRSASKDSAGTPPSLRPKAVGKSVMVTGYVCRSLGSWVLVSQGCALWEVTALLGAEPSVAPHSRSATTTRIVTALLAGLHRSVIPQEMAVALTVVLCPPRVSESNGDHGDGWLMVRSHQPIDIAVWHCCLQMCWAGVIGIVEYMGPVGHRLDLPVAEFKLSWLHSLDSPGRSQEKEAESEEVRCSCMAWA